MATGFVFASIAFAVEPVTENNCPGTSINHPEARTFIVSRVIDGDTLVLNDDRRVRLIGLNALELQSQNLRDRLWAKAATKTLVEAIGKHPVALIEGSEKHDRHGRTLAHVIVHSGDNAAGLLVENGLAVAVAIGHNTRCATHLLALEETARQKSSGIWGDPGTWFINQPRLYGNERGFHVLQSRVRAVRGSRRSPILELHNGLILKLGSVQLKSGGVQLDQSNHHGLTRVRNLIGKPIEVRGWLSASAGRVSLTLHNAANLRVLSH